MNKRLAGCGLCLVVLGAAARRVDARGEPSAQPALGLLRIEAAAAYDAKDAARCARLYDELATRDRFDRGAYAYRAAGCDVLAGRRDDAFTALRTAVQRGFRDLTQLDGDETLRPLRGDARWAAVVKDARRNVNSHLGSLNVELYLMVREDDVARSGVDWSVLDPQVVMKFWTQIGAADLRRRQRVDAMLQKGELKSSGDYYHAAIIFQHGEAVADFDKARRMALQAVALDPSNREARWLAAAAQDRALVESGRPQRYGTQYMTKDGQWSMPTVDASITDEERAKWYVPPLIAIKQHVEDLKANRVDPSKPWPPYPKAE